MRVTASEVIGAEVLPPILAGRRNEHPELALELVITDRMQDLLLRGADIAVRMARPRQELLVARHVGQIELGLHAHQRYLSRHGTPKTMVEMVNHALIGFDQTTAFICSAGKALRLAARSLRRAHGQQPRAARPNPLQRRDRRLPIRNCWPR